MVDRNYLQMWLSLTKAVIEMSMSFFMSQPMAKLEGCLIFLLRVGIYYGGGCSRLGGGCSGLGGVAVDLVGVAVDLVGVAVDLVGVAVDLVGVAVDLVGVAVASELPLNVASRYTGIEMFLENNITE